MFIVLLCFGIFGGGVLFGGIICSLFCGVSFGVGVCCGGVCFGSLGAQTLKCEYVALLCS